MNLIDCYVKEVLSREEKEINGRPWVIYRVSAVAYGHTSVCTLMYKPNEEPEIKEGFIFQA